MGIIGIIDAYIAHLKEVIKKRSEFDLNVALREVHYTEGLVKAISILDEVIAVIRASKNKSDAEANLVKEFGFSEAQAEKIVMLQLYKLTNTDILELQNKLESLNKIIAGLREILASEEKLALVAKEELRKIKREYGVPRKTEIRETAKEINISAEDLIIKESVMVVLTNEGYIKKVPMKSFTSANGDETALKPGDYALNIFETSTVNKMIIVTKKGNYIYVPVNDIPWCKWKDLGKHVSNLVTIAPDDAVLNSFIISEKVSDDNLLVVTKNGCVKQVNVSDLIVSRYTKLYTYIKLKDDDEVISVTYAKENTMLVTKSGYYISYKTSEIPTTSGKSSGVKGINLKDDEVVAGLTYNDTDEYLNVFTNQKTAKRIKLSELNQLSRAKRGSMVIKKVKTTNYEIVSALITQTKDQIGLSMLEDIGELKNTDIPIMDVQSTGSSIAKKKFIKAFVFANIEKVYFDETKEKAPKKDKETEKQETLEFIEDFKI